MEINNTITAPSPAFSPRILMRKDNPSSGVVGMVKLDIVIFSGVANLIILAPALIEKSVNNINETIRACFFKLGKRFRIPLPKIAP